LFLSYPGNAFEGKAFVSSGAGLAGMFLGGLQPFGGVAHPHAAGPHGPFYPRLIRLSMLPNMTFSTSLPAGTSYRQLA
jgi:hypothetical protein